MPPEVAMPAGGGGTFTARGTLYLMPFTLPLGAAPEPFEVPVTPLSEQDREILAQAAFESPPGALVEVGVFQGGSAVFLELVATEQGRDLFLYDTFAGMPCFDAAHDIYAAGTFNNTDYDSVCRLFEGKPHVHVVQGAFPKSLVEMPPVAFVHADADQYDSTVAICRDMPPRMVPGGRIYFDDYGTINRGCTKAVDEFFPNRVVLPNGRALVTLDGRAVGATVTL